MGKKMKYVAIQPCIWALALAMGLIVSTVKAETGFTEAGERPGTTPRQTNLNETDTNIHMKRFNDGTTTNEVSGAYYDWTKTRSPERPWMHDYNKTLVIKFFLCSRDGEGNVDKVYLTFSDALNVLRRIDSITLGIPKIVYLVGWQYNGHDSKYPAWNEVNARLKRPQDSTALDSLKWLIEAAKAYNTTISLHLNMFDAYMESPLWDEYLAGDIIAKDSSGNPIKGEVFYGMQSYQISYAREWELGYAQQRISQLIEMIPELKEARTIHIDAFHSMRASGPGEPISPYLGLSIEDEMAAQRKILRYWRNQEIDVTSEGSVYWLRKDPFLGLQPMTWHYDEMTYARKDWLGKPKNFTSLPAELSAYTPMHTEPEIMQDPESLPGLIEQFCLQVVPWYYRRNADVSKASTVIITDDEVVCPVLWKDQTLIAYSRQGFSDRRIRIPSHWVDAIQVKLSILTLDGLEDRQTLFVDDGPEWRNTSAKSISFSLQPGEAVVISPLSVAEMEPLSKEEINSWIARLGEGKPGDDNTATRMLVHVVGEPAVQPLLNVLAPNPPSFKDATLTESHWARLRAAHCLRMLSYPHMVEVLEREIQRDPHPGMRLIQSIYMIQVDIEKALHALVDDLARNVYTVPSIVITLKNIGDPRVIPLLEPLLDDPRVEVRTGATEVLSALRNGGK